MKKSVFKGLMQTIDQETNVMETEFVFIAEYSER